MSQVIGQVTREVVGCRNWPVMRVPQFLALRRNAAYFFSLMGTKVYYRFIYFCLDHEGDLQVKCIFVLSINIMARKVSKTFYEYTKIGTNSI